MSRFRGKKGRHKKIYEHKELYKQMIIQIKLF